MSNFIERVVLLGVGLSLGIAASRTEWEPAAIPLYIALATLIIGGRLAVLRYRNQRDARRAAAR